MPDIQHKRGSRADLNTLAAADGLLLGQVYLITDEDRLAVATAVDAYQAVEKEGGGGGGSALELYAENPSSPTNPSVTGENSVGIGYNVTSSGFRSLAMVENSVASGTRSIAIGLGADATSTQSLALGANAQAVSGTDATAFTKSRASGASSLAAAIANNTSTYGATGANSIAMGDRSKATGSRSIAISGFGASASGANSLAIGYQAKANQTYASAFGYSSKAYGIYSFAGTESHASGSKSVALGIGDTGTSYGAQHTSGVAIGFQALTTADKQIALGSSTAQVKVSGAYTLPTADGTADQVLTTDGSGAVTFADAGGGGAALELYAENPSSPTAPSATGTNAIAVGSGANASSTASISIGVNSVSSGLYSQSFGTNATATGIYSTAIGTNTDTTSNYSTSLGQNSSSAGSQAVSGSGAMALGGSYASGTDSFAAAIANNTSTYGAVMPGSVAIGFRSKAGGQNSTVIGGTSNSATGSYGFAAGPSSNIAAGTFSVAIGDACEAIERNSFAIGHDGKSVIQGKLAFGSGKFSTVSDAQNGTFVLRRATTDANTTELTTNNGTASATNQIILPNNSAFAFHGTIVARQQASGGTASAAWKIEGLIRREGSAGTTVLVNSATTVLDNTPAWGMALSADTTNGGLKVEATGEASTNIRWVATINTSEVTY